MKTTGKNLFLAGLVLFLVACGPSAPFFGSWGSYDEGAKVETNGTAAAGGLGQKITFTPEEVVIDYGSNLVTRQKVKYKKINRTTWNISTDKGEHWSSVECLGEDKIKTDFSYGYFVIFTKIEEEPEK